MILAGDVGGTKTRLALFSDKQFPGRPVTAWTCRNSEYPDFETILGEFLARTGRPVSKACLGVAGPVVNGQGRLTNLPWVITEKWIAERFQINSVRLINDLNATARAVPFLEPADLKVLNTGRADPEGNVAVIAPGTGLGEAFLTRDGQRWRAHATEGGHADFSPGSALEMALLADLREKYDHVSQESVCSGKGIARIHRFLDEKGEGEEPQWLTEKMNRESDPAPVIVEAAMGDPPSSDLCRKTVDLFVSLLGAEAGNLALKVSAAAGVYLAGAISRAVLPFLEQGGFMEAFRRKGRLSEFMAGIPVSLILDPDVAMLGAAICCLESFGERS
jgi:glucokinase